MTDLEMLTLAAKVAGTNILYLEEKDYFIDSSDTYWNPLEYDEDAFRLMVALGMTVKFIDIDDKVCVQVFNKDNIDLTLHVVGSDRMGDVRRAVVRFAAWLAKSNVESSLDF